MKFPDLEDQVSNAVIVPNTKGLDLSACQIHCRIISHGYNAAAAWIGTSIKLFESRENFFVGEQVRYSIITCNNDIETATVMLKSPSHIRYREFNTQSSLLCFLFRPFYRLR